MEELGGNRVNRIYLNEERTAIKFNLVAPEHLVPGCIVYKGNGDCCAGVEFEDIEYPADKPYSRQGYLVDKVNKIDDYGWRIVTDRGDIVISGRYYDSSGWGGYDASVDLCDDDKYIAKQKWFEFMESK